MVKDRIFGGVLLRLDLRRGPVAQKRPVNEKYYHEKGAAGGHASYHTKAAERHLFQRITESNGVCRMGRQYTMVGVDWEGNYNYYTSSVAECCIF